MSHLVLEHLIHIRWDIVMHHTCLVARTWLFCTSPSMSLQTLQSLLLQNLLIGCVHWPAKPGIQDTGRSMQALYRPVMQNLGGLMPHIENDTGPAGGLLHYGRSAS